MILLLIEFLRIHLGLHIPAVFVYTSTRALLAAATALAVTLLAGTSFIQKLYSLKIGQPIRQYDDFLLGELHKGKKNTPTMGGGLILFSMLLALFIWMDLSSAFTWILGLTTLVFGALGGWDDYLKLRYQSSKGLSARWKMFFQLLWAVVVISYLQIPEVTRAVNSVLGIKLPVIKEFSKGVIHSISLHAFSARFYIPFLKGPLFVFSGIGLLFLWLFYIFVIVGASNAVNLTDGLDGLAAGLIIFVASSIGIVAFLANNIEIAEYLNIVYIGGAGEIAIYMAALAGAALGFLWFNSHPAEVFMGDMGSLALGGALGVSSILLKREFFLAITGMIFVLEAMSVLIQIVSYNFFSKKRVFRCAPLHHHFEYMGWPESKVVIRFWIIGFLLSLIGLSSLKFQ
jgi:phospho-N-acetylmuramoyl-pentapeptide-transferase